MLMEIENLRRALIGFYFIPTPLNQEDWLALLSWIFCMRDMIVIFNKDIILNGYLKNKKGILRRSSLKQYRSCSVKFKN